MRSIRYEIALGIGLATAFWGVTALLYSRSLDLKDVAGPIATVIAATAAAYVAYTLGKAQIDVAERNWQTSNEKIVLDLFERRIAIFEEIRAVVSEVLRSGQPSDKDYFEFCKAVDRVPYYFGAEIGVYLETLRLLIIDLQLDATIIANDYAEDRHERIWGRTERMKQLVGFYERSPELFGPYIRAHQRVG